MVGPQSQEAHSATRAMISWPSSPDASADCGAEATQSASRPSEPKSNLSGWHQPSADFLGNLTPYYNFGHRDGLNYGLLSTTGRRAPCQRIGRDAFPEKVWEAKLTAKFADLTINSPTKLTFLQ